MEVDPQALHEPVLRGCSGSAAKSVPIGAIFEPWLDRHAEAIAAHARMLWGDGARGAWRVSG